MEGAAVGAVLSLSGCVALGELLAAAVVVALVALFGAVVGIGEIVVFASATELLVLPVPIVLLENAGSSSGSVVIGSALVKVLLLLPALVTFSSLSPLRLSAVLVLFFFFSRQYPS